jgi:putative ABC transport system permease protein
VKALRRKLLRDLAHQRWQALTIALVVASGVASYVCVRGAYDSLHAARDRYYARNRFADVWASLSRAPRSVATELERIEGVSLVYPRIARSALMPLPGTTEPVAARVISIPPAGAPPLCDLQLSAGRLPDPARSDEIALLEIFARHRGIAVGDTVPLVLNGSRRELRVAALASSPEYVLATQEGIVPGEDRFAVVWMREPVLEAAFDLERAFDEALFSLDREHRDHDLAAFGREGRYERQILAAIDAALEPYGGRGATPRRLQRSHHALSGELEQLSGMATSVPALFLFVAAFLLNVSLSRMIELQRPEIAILKCLGYSAREIGGHYLAFALLVAGVGAALGVALGAWMGNWLVELYLEFFRLPGEAFALTPRLVLVGVGVSVGSAVAGGLVAVRRITQLAPADAMRPPTPASYRSSILTRGPWMRLLEMAGTIVLREAERSPTRVVLSAIGIAFSVAIMVVGHFQGDAIGPLVEALFEHGMREDLSIELSRAAPRRALGELAHLPGVERVEGMRRTFARVSHRGRHRDVPLMAGGEDVTMRLVVDQRGDVVPRPAEGIVITRKLGEVLGIGVGEELDVELLEGRHTRARLRVTGLADEMFGLFGHLGEHTLAALLEEEPSFDLALLRTDDSRLPALRAALARYPGIAQLVRRRAIIESFHEQTGRSMSIMTAVMTFFAVVIAIGVVYNNMRVTLSVRARDLATMRVLGFTRREVGAVLFGEMVLHLAVGVPLGLGLGRWFCGLILGSVDPERYRWPLTISSETYAYAALTVALASLLCWLFVRRRLDRLDLIAVLKTRE